MNDSLVALSGPAIPPEVQEFAVEKGVSRYLDAVIGLARQAFPSSSLCVSVGQDAEDETHQYIALDVEAGGRSAEELLVGRQSSIDRYSGVQLSGSRIARQSSMDG
jgi:hypothetical protein